MLQLFITVGQTTVDYTRNLDQTTIQIQEQINLPATFNFSLTPIGVFNAPPLHAYVQLYSSTYDRSLFTGFISAEPTRVFQSLAQAAATDQDGQLLQYQIVATSDEYLLNLKAIPFIPAYINRSQGDILTDLANILCPGFFDTSAVASGDIVPYFSYSPQQSWSQIAKEFADGSRYRYKVRDKAITYCPYGDQPLGIQYDERQNQSQFDPFGLQTTVLNVPTVNDVTVIGDVEAGNNHEDYFIGDGFTGNFPLLHKVFRGSSTLLVQESWNEGQLNTQQWFLQDPGDNFDFSAGALNVVTASGVISGYGESFLEWLNGFELAGGTDIQVGEIIWTDYNEGVLGGIYTDESYTLTALLAGFMITSPNGVQTAGSDIPYFSGTVTASGVVMQPWFSGSAVGAPVVSQLYHTYVLQIVVTAPQYVRYQQTFRTVEGEQYGGASYDVSGTITFNIQDYDVAAATGFFYTPQVYSTTVNNVPLPNFVLLALVNNKQFNMSLTNTTFATMPLGTLQSWNGPSGLFMPTGSILPMLPPGSGGYIGPVQPWPSAASANIQPPPGLLAAYPTNQVLGNGFDLQAAQITQGNEADTLAFYAQSLPAAGTPVRFQSWEAQAAVSRLQNQADIIQESFVVGDDGIRGTIVTNLNPLPRTSEDCDNAALAYLQDRGSVFYNGTYTITDTPGNKIFHPLTTDQQLFPTVGRFLNVHAPKRKIVTQKFLVTALTVSCLDMMSETLTYQIGFGADLNLEKVLLNFVDLAPQQVLTPTDQANPPNPRYTQNVYNSYLPDLVNVQVDPLSISPTQAVVYVADPYYGPIEVRRLDTNWGRGPTTSDFIQYANGPQFTLTRQQYEQVWYMRPVQTTAVTGTVNVAGSSVEWLGGAYFSTGWLVGTAITINNQQCTVASVQSPTQLTITQNLGTISSTNYSFNQTISSRRSKVLRVRYPLQPAAPLFNSANNTNLSFNLNGDVRNIYGFELRMPDNQTILYQAVVVGAVVTFDLLSTPFPTLPQYGQTTWEFYAYFFNQQWTYSPVLDILVPNSTLGGQLIQIAYVPATTPTVSGSV